MGSIRSKDDWELWEIHDMLINLCFGINRVRDDSRINHTRVRDKLDEDQGIMDYHRTHQEEVHVQLNLDISTNVVLSARNT